MKSLKTIQIIAKNTFREIIRDRILYGLMMFALLLIGFSMVLGQLSFAEQTRISVNFGFTAIHLSAVILSIFVGSTLVAREIDKKTILTLLVRPISRTEFLIGKCMGLMGVIFVAVSGLGLVLVGILLGIGVELQASFFVGMYGVMIEAAVLLGITLFFGAFASPMLAVSFSIGMFLIGHWLESLKYFTKNSDSGLFKGFGAFVTSALPNLELFNWRSLFVYNDPVPWGSVAAATVYMSAWVAVLISVAAFVLRRRDLG